MITVKDLSFEYPNTKALNNISFEIQKGSITALVGPNGAGKTTLLKCLAGLSEPYSGQVIINDINVHDNPGSINRLIGYMPDFIGLFDDMTVRQALLYYSMAYDLDEEIIENNIIEKLRIVELEEKLNSKISTLSRGMKQRVAIAQAMIHDPLLLILDEPASGLDPEARSMLSKIFVDINNAGATIIVSSHILAELDEYANDVIILRNGSQVIQTSKEDKHRKTLMIKLLEKNDITYHILSEFETVEKFNYFDNSIIIDFTGTDEQQNLLLHNLIDNNVKITEFFVKKQKLEDNYLKSIDKGS